MRANAVWYGMLAVVVAAGPAGAMTSVPEGGASPAAVVCPVSVRVGRLKDHDDITVLSLWSDEAAGSATGNVILYGGGKRYSVPFTNAIAADNRTTAILPTPLVVRLPDGTRVESAYVGALDVTADCPIHAPYVASSVETYRWKYDGPDIKIYPGWDRVWPTFLAAAAAATPIALTDGTPAVAPACEKPYVMAVTTSAAAPVPPRVASPASWYSGTVGVRVTLAADGSVIGVRVDKGSGSAAFDRSAADAVARSTFVPQMYRCAPVSGNYLFIVQF